ncbi:peptidoglycan endopeptidase RipA precursor [Oerskovia enterophila]|uniref:Peptidoglycan endopeptidase RipA n=1 Tax=Oerskovia enterophila TaxID=43678 RepID=A0ABX2Y495_9CELL|nr:peptidoglycan endopeptidase RipA precursor [Oerskovia enterophila]
MATAAIQAACSKLGVNYSRGGGHNTTPGPSGGVQGWGLDCSGLTRYAYWAATGTDALGTGSAFSQWNLRSRYTTVSWANLQPGDLLFYNWPGEQPVIDHVTLYLGNGWMIEAPIPGTKVKVSSAYSSGFVGAMRIGSSSVTPGPRADRISDWSGDGYADVLGVDTSGDLWYYPNNGLGLASRGWLQGGFQGFTQVMSADWSGDGFADLLAVDGTGTLWQYPNNALAIQSRQSLGTGWDIYTTVMAADWSGDGLADVLALDAAGTLWYYPHNGSGLSPRVWLQNGFYGYTQITAADWSGDGFADILAVDPNGELWYYPNNAQGIQSRQSLGTGWGIYTKVMAADWSGDGLADVLALDAAGTLWYYPHNGSGLTPRVWLQDGFNGFTHVL